MLAIEAFEVGRVLNNQRLTSMYFVVLLLLLLSIPVRTPGTAFSALLADTPPMGWNSWDGYGTTINEADFKANADWLAKHLRPYGWEYVVVDADWFVTNPVAEGNSKAFHYVMDVNGRYLPPSSRFSSPYFTPLATTGNAWFRRFVSFCLQS